MTISFATIPAVIRTPGQFAEFNSSLAAAGVLPAMPNKCVIVGLRKYGSGTVATNVLAQANSSADAETQWGHGSQMAGMVEAFKAANPYIELWGVGIDPDNASGVKAAGSFAFTGTATAAGNVNAYIAGARISVPVAINDAAATVATALYTAINAYCSAHNLPVVSTNTPAGTTVVTAIDKGVHGNDIDLRLNYQVGESLPTGIACTVTAMTSGAGTIDVTSAIAALGSSWFPTIISGIYDATNVARFEVALGTAWGPMVQHDGQLFYADNGSEGTLAALGAARNSKFSTLVGCGLSPTPPWIFAVDAAAADAGEPDPSRPRQTLPLPNCLPPAAGAEYTWTERNTLLGVGVSTYTVTPAGACIIERLITTYQTSPAGAADTSYLSIETMRALAYIRYTWNTLLNLKFPRYKLAADGTTFDPGQPIVTPSLLKSEAIAWYQSLIDAGQAQDKATFAAGVNIQINSTDHGRVDMILTSKLLSGFRVAASQIAFLF
jgi:phage tail sheath gpL-like